MFIHIYNKTCHNSIPDSKTAAYGHQSNSGRYMLGQYRTAVISKWHSYLDFADVEINIHGTAGVIEIGAPQIPWNSMELLASSKLAHLEHMELLVSAKLVHSKFHGIPWISMELLVSAKLAHSKFHGIPWNSMELLVSAKLAHSKFHGIPWNSMELLESSKLAHQKFHATTHVIEIGALLVPWNSMEFHGTARVSEISAF